MTKTVALSEDAYASLATCKVGGESFSDTVLRITKEKKRSPRDFFGIWKDDKDIARIFEAIRMQIANLNCTNPCRCRSESAQLA
ncbi:antitoxin VapB family protein [Candidatus Woesearchaeota archaeon]|nr:antitoxin VapB family protein [Candidatus Woesearchaeota archaeon]